MKKIVCVVLAMMMALACAATAEGANVSITTGRPTDKAAKTMVVQMDNEPGARPQLGIASADIVYEVELYNGGYTRYTAVFNDNVPDLVEAVRSARIVNADIYTEYGGAFVHFGGQKYEGSSVYDYFGSIHVDERWDGIGYDNGSDTSDFYRDRSRKAPNNVACKLANLVEKTDWTGVTCKSPLKFNAAFTVPAGNDVTSFRIPYRDSYTPSYVWDAAANRYQRYYNGNAYVDRATNEQVMADNIIVQSVEYAWYSGESDRPKVTTTGSGKCQYFMGGKSFTGTWKRDAITSNTVYLDDAGNEVLFNPGVTFIQFLKTEKDIEILA